MASDQPLPALVVHRGHAPCDQRHDARAAPARNDPRHGTRCKTRGVRSDVVVDLQANGVSFRPHQQQLAIEQRRAAKQILTDSTRVERAERPAPERNTVAEEVVRRARGNRALGADAMR